MNENKATIHRFWVSWVQPTKDYRPVNFPPNPKVLGWWCSGYRDEQAIIVALIEAEDEKTAEQVIKKDWPEWSVWRFIYERDSDYQPPGDRFPLSEWMRQRIKNH